ncbi:MAG TPA: AAA family ATPase, partial [Thermoplasmata archaeon]|nr:AAA family ATPase [Thermoplasmata archaeon]
VVKGFTGDGAIALFGVPSSIEDAPLRACRAGLLILQRLAAAADEFERDLGAHPQIRIGIHTGPVVVGPVATGEAAEITAIGDTVNLAARLERQAPPGAVLLSEATFGLVGGRIVGEFVGDYYIRGKSTPQRVYRLTGIREGASRFDAVLDRGLTSYVGRSDELTSLEQRFDRSRGAFAVVDVVGDPGMGKSRLLYEFRLRLRPKAAYVLVGNCSSTGNGTPYLPFAELVRTASQIGPGDDEAVQLAKLTSTLRSVGLDSPLHRALLMNLLGLTPPADALAGVDGSLVGIQTRELVRLWLTTVGRRTGLVLLLEDLQWIDPASQELLRYLIESEDPAHLLLVATRRPEYRPPWSTAPGVSLLALGPLSPRDTLHLVQARTGAEQLPETMGRFIVEKAEGNALFAEEITTLLFEAGVVRRTDAGLQFLEDRTVQLPTSLRSLLATRLDRLEAGDKALLQVAAVVGRQFRPELVAAAAGAPEGSASRLTAMQTLDLVYPDPTTGEWWFKHALIRDALYDGVLESRRETLHLRV